MLLLFLAFVRFRFSSAVHGRSRNNFQKRAPTTCGWDLGPPNPDDCKVAIDRLIPNSHIDDDINFIPIGTAGPDDAVVLPLFYEEGQSAPGEWFALANLRRELYHQRRHHRTRQK